MDSGQTRSGWMDLNPRQQGMKLAGCGLSQVDIERYSQGLETMAVDEKGCLN